jgi:biopolymer transport protein ExbD
MAKREAPEINAGSMADIAFLLLIFFLVTTTMDKDTAYARKIPKKVEVVDPEPVQKKNIYKISINNKQNIQARDSIIKPEDIEELNSRVKHFYLVNRGKNEDRDVSYPYYSVVSKSFIDQKIAEAYSKQENYEKLLETDTKYEKFIEQMENEIAEWNRKNRILDLYIRSSGKKEMPEIAFQAHVRLESFIDTDYSAYVAVQSEIEKAIAEMRDDESQELFGITYTAMRQYYQTNLLEKTPKVKEYKDKMDLIELLFPLRIIEVKPKR